MTSVPICFLVGPLTTVLVTRSSHRTAIILGGLLSALGLVASANVPNIVGFYFTFGIMSGKLLLINDLQLILADALV